MTRYVDRTFIDEDVTLDGHSFIDCTFDGCVIRYNGGPLHIEGALAIKNGGDIRYGPGIDAFDNPLSRFLVGSVLEQGGRQLSDEEIANEPPVTPKKDLG